MGLPTIEKTWIFDRNHDYPSTGVANNDAATALLGLKNTLINNGIFGAAKWTVVGSSDGTAAGAPNGTLDGVDRWAAIANLVSAAENIAHGWIVLQQAGINPNFQICINLKNGSQFSLELVVSPITGFADNGSATNRPTAALAANEFVLIDGNWFDPNGGVFNGKIHTEINSDGKCNRIVGYSNNFPYLFWAFDVPKNPVAGWATPAISIAVVTANATPSPTYAKLNAITNAKGITGGGKFNAFLSTRGFNADTAGNLMTFPNDITGEYSMYDIGISSLTAGSRGDLGQMFDMWFGSAVVNDADNYPNNVALRDFVQVGNIILPWANDGQANAVVMLTA